MINIQLFNKDGSEAGNIELKEDIFAKDPKDHVIHSVLKWQLASMRQGTANSKTRAEVRGGGRKPWRQKGTGRARSGSIRSPLWRGGGVIFGPRPRDYCYSIPKKEKELAIKMILSDKIKSERFKVVENLEIDKPKTKNIMQILKNLKINNALLVVDESHEKIGTAARNIKDIKPIKSRDLNVFDLLKFEWIVLDKKALLNISERMKS